MKQYKDLVPDSHEPRKRKDSYNSMYTFIFCINSPIMFFKGVSILQLVKINRSIKALWYITNKNLLYKAWAAFVVFLLFSYLPCQCWVEFPPLCFSL